MKALMMALIAAGFTASAVAADDMKKNDPSMGNDAVTMQDCKDHMAMRKKDGMTKDDAMMKKDAMCSDMMKKDSAMAPDSSASGAMMKK